MDKASRRIRKN